MSQGPRQRRRNLPTTAGAARVAVRAHRTWTGIAHGRAAGKANRGKDEQSCLQDQVRSVNLVEDGAVGVPLPFRCRDGDVVLPAAFVAAAGPNRRRAQRIPIPSHASPAPQPPPKHRPRPLLTPDPVSRTDRAISSRRACRAGRPAERRRLAGRGRPTGRGSPGEWRRPARAGWRSWRRRNTRLHLSCSATQLTAHKLV